MKKRLGGSLVVVISLLFMFALSYAAGMKKSQKDVQNNSFPSATQVLKCADLEVRGTFLRWASPNPYVSYRFQICNVGNADFTSPPLSPAKVTLAVYDPNKPLTGGNYRIILEGPISEIIEGSAMNLAKGACTREFSSSESIPDFFSFIDWGHRTPRAGECQSEIEFSLNVTKNVPGDPNFKPNEDCRKSNNLVKERFQFMSECPY